VDQKCFRLPSSGGVGYTEAIRPGFLARIRQLTVEPTISTNDSLCLSRLLEYLAGHLKSRKLFKLQYKPPNIIARGRRNLVSRRGINDSTFPKQL